MTLVWCPNPDCHPGCGNAMAQKNFEVELIEAMGRPVSEDVLRCPTCDAEMVYLSRTVS